MFQWIGLINIDLNRITYLLLLIRLKAHIDFQYQSVRRRTSFFSDPDASLPCLNPARLYSTAFSQAVCPFILTSDSLTVDFRALLCFSFSFLICSQSDIELGDLSRPAPNHPAPYLPPFSLTFPLIRFAQHFYFSAAK